MTKVLGKFWLKENRPAWGRLIWEELSKDICGYMVVNRRLIGRGIRSKQSESLLQWVRVYYAECRDCIYDL